MCREDACPPDSGVGWNMSYPNLKHGSLSSHPFVARLAVGLLPGKVTEQSDLATGLKASGIELGELWYRLCTMMHGVQNAE